MPNLNEPKDKQTTPLMASWGLNFANKCTKFRWTLVKVVITFERYLKYFKDLLRVDKVCAELFDQLECAVVCQTSGANNYRSFLFDLSNRLYRCRREESVLGAVSTTSANATYLISSEIKTSRESGENFGKSELKWLWIFGTSESLWNGMECSRVFFAHFNIE